MSFLVELPLQAYRTDAFERFSLQPEFNIGTARALMWLSQLAYEVRDASQKVDPVLRRWGLEPVSLITRGKDAIFPLASTRGIIAAGRGATLIAFAGTDPLAIGNWITNFSLGPPARDVHHGFDAGVAAVWHRLSTVLEAHKTRPLFIAGHSLGGALSVIAAERAARELGVMPQGVYTFGAPRVAASAFFDAYSKCGLGERTYRFIHGHDIVPTVPPSRLGFRHVGRMMTCTRAGRFAKDASLSPSDCNDPPFVDTVKNGYRQRLQDMLSGEFPESSRAGVIGLYQRYVLTPLIGDHLPQRYRDALE